MIRKSLVLAVGTAFLVLSTAAWAQYTPPMGGTGGTSPTPGSPTYTKKSYGVNKGAMAAVAGGGVAAGALLLRHYHHRNTMTACVGSDGKTLDDGKDVYSVLGGSSLTPNERLEVAGKKTTSDTGAPALEVTGVRKDLGRCEQPAVSAKK